MKNTKYYLSSLDSYEFSQKRDIEFIKLISVLSNGNKKEAWLVKVTPNVIGQKYNLMDIDINYLVLSARHSGVTVAEIKSFPCFVYIARIITNNIPDANIIDSENLEVIAWGEIYKD